MITYTDIIFYDFKIQFPSRRAIVRYLISHFCDIQSQISHLRLLSNSIIQLCNQKRDNGTPTLSFETKSNPTSYDIGVHRRIHQRSRFKQSQTSSPRILERWKIQERDPGTGRYWGTYITISSTRVSSQLVKRPRNKRKIVSGIDRSVRGVGFSVAAGDARFHGR